MSSTAQQKLNLGCGFNKLDGFINVDHSPACNPDMVWDLEQTPWPWESNSISEIRMEHVLEHIGKDADTYLSLWKEIYRVCAPDAFIHIMVPHWNHENFHHDPTHVRAITPVGIQLFNQDKNFKSIAEGGRETKLGLYTGIDLELKDEDVEYFYSGDIVHALNAGEFTHDGLLHLRDHQNNIANEIRMKVRVVKPARITSKVPQTNLDEIQEMEAHGNFGEAYELLQKMSDGTKGRAAKIGWHLIRLGDFEHGYPLLHEERDAWRAEFVYSLPRDKQYLQGTPLSGRRIFIAPEGGLGDQILCARFVEAYKKLGAYVLLGGDPSLHTIFKTLPIKPDEICDPHTVQSYEYDYWVSSFSAPIVLGLSHPLQNLTYPYLKASERLRAKWKTILGAQAEGKPKIGIRWQGKQPEHSNLLRVESIPFDAFLQLRELGVLYSFQQEKGAEVLSHHKDIVDLGSQLATWEDTLACMAEMDMMVTCCTSTAHAAGALGVPTYVVTTMNPYFPWIGEEHTSAWYPSVRVFRQPSFGAWEEAIAQVKAHILTTAKETDTASLFKEAVAAGNRGEHDTALRLYRELLAKVPEDSELYHAIRYNLSWYEFREENFDRGFLYRIESGRKLGFIITTTYTYPQPYLTADTDIRGKTILLSSECGAGDDFMNARYARVLKERGAAKIIWASEKDLQSVFNRIEGIDEATTHEALGDTPFDYWILTLELPLVLKPSVHNISCTPYLTPDPRYVAKWKARLTQDNTLKIGVRWKGEESRDKSQNRSLPLSFLERLLSDPQITPYSLQRDYGYEDLSSDSPLIDWGKDLESWEDTIAALSILDLVITSDTSIAHARAALGKETWVVVRPFSYFAWIPNNEDTSVWYESVRIFRESVQSAWEVPFAKMEAALKTKLGYTKTEVPQTATRIEALYPDKTRIMHIHPQDELVSTILRTQRWYSRGDLRLYDLLLKEGDFYIDGGANIGWYTLYAAEKVGKSGKVIAVEPDVRNASLLRENLKHNSVEHAEVIQKALGSSAGNGRIYNSSFNFGDHYVLPQNETISNERESSEVAITTLDELITQERRIPKFIKLDIQGGEIHALQGLAQTLTQAKPFLLIEFAPGLLLRNGSSPFELFAFIEKEQYFPFRVFDDYIDAPLVRPVSIEELLQFTKENRATEIGWDLLLVHKNTDTGLMDALMRESGA